ncbi:MAG: hypothetical protein JW787_06665 [Sedimentisphaerales bacterium]|nr:hypothetical protein [Sedimentisphaerales bacterium]
MDNYKKLSEELLKNDGIDPANISDSERAMFEQLLDKHLISEQKTVLWRIIMKSNIMKLAAAAMIIIACSTGIIFWKSTGSGIALGDVLTRIEQVSGYTYQMKTIVTDPEQRGTETSTATVLVSKEGDLKMTVTQVDSNNFQKPPDWQNSTVDEEWYLLPTSNSIVFIFHEKKEYSRAFIENPKHHLYKKQYNEPREIIKQILNCEHKSLGQSVIDGITVEGFQTTDKAYQGGFFGHGETLPKKKVDVKLWVDVNTFLPVKFEEDIITSGEIEDIRIQNFIYDFRWNVIINPGDFEPNIPEDYNTTLGGDIIILDTNEENAIKGFKLFTDSFDKYPIDIQRSGVDYGINSGLDPNSSVMEQVNKMSEEEKTGKINELLTSQMPTDFYKMLVKENKEPVYYGETVKPDDSSKVLLRWKLEDDQYRIIYGDLQAETVTKEKLTELEAALPK